MKPSGRFGLSGWQKAVLWIAFLLCIWRFLQVPAIFDAILTFYAVGQIPGTDIVLSPDAALWFVFITSSVGALILFAKLFIFRPKRSVVYAMQYARPEPQPVVAVQPLPVLPPAPIVVAPLPVAPRPTKPPKAGVAVRTVRSKTIGGVARLMRTVRPRLVALGVVMRRFAVAMFRFAKKYGLRTAAFVALMLVTAWDWAKPYVQRFDTWLEVRLNQNEVSATLIEIVRRLNVLVRDAWHRAIAMTDNRQQ